ncbi:MAG: ATP F0F1 synthase subunit B [Planctomycetota bacterium]
MSVNLMAIALAAAETSHAAEEASGGGLPQFDPSSFPSQLFWLVITFSFLYWVMSSFVLPRLGGVIEERRDRIADDLDQASEFKRQAEDAQATYNKALADAKAKAQSIAADTRADLDAELQQLQSEADAKAAQSLEAAETRIADMKSQATAKVKEAAVETTRAIVETLIDEHPTDDAVAEAINAQYGASA